MQVCMKRLMVVAILLGLCLSVLAVAIPQRINYQGVLKNKTTGQVLPDGDYSVTFRLYTVSSGGSSVWSETATVTITNGILNYQLGSVTPLTLAFDANYYLSVQVSGDSEMYPRERLTSVGYAYRAANADNATNVGGIELSGLDDRYLNASGSDSWVGYLYGVQSTGGYTLHLANYGGGQAMYATNSATGSTIFTDQYGTGRAFSGYNYADFGTGVGGLNYGLNGYGLYGYAPGGIGVYGYSTSSTYAIYGVNGRTSGYDGGFGVYGVTDDYAYSGAGVKGKGYVGVRGEGLFQGVYGVSDSYGLYGVGTGGTGYGLYASGSYVGILGSGSNFGVVGNGWNGYGVYATSTGTSNPTIYAKNNGAGQGINAYSRKDYALYAESTGYRGAYIKGNSSYYSLYVDGSGGNYGGYVYGRLYVNGDLTVTGSKTGFVVDLCKNSGTDTLEVGDVVVIQGSNAAVLSEIPVMLVAKTNTSYNTGVVGVVNRGMKVGSNTGEASIEFGAGKPNKEMEVEPSESAVIGANQYVNVVTLGAFKAIKVDASYGAIQPGDLLVTSPNPGYAMKAEPELINGKPFYPSGCIIGKALGTLASGQGKIPVFVGHQ